MAGFEGIDNGTPEVQEIAAVAREVERPMVTYNRAGYIDRSIMARSAQSKARAAKRAREEALWDLVLETADTGKALHIQLSAIEDRTPEGWQKQLSLRATELGLITHMTKQPDGSLIAWTTHKRR